MENGPGEEIGDLSGEKIDKVSMVRMRRVHGTGRRRVHARCIRICQSLPWCRSKVRVRTSARSTQDESATGTDSIFLAISLSGTPGPQTLIPASRDSLVTSHSSIPSSSWHQASSRRKVSRSLKQAGR